MGLQRPVASPRKRESEPVGCSGEARVKLPFPSEQERAKVLEVCERHQAERPVGQAACTHRPGPGSTSRTEETRARGPA